MTKDNSTGKNKDFYELGKKMFDPLNPHIAHNPKVVGPVQEPVAWMIYTKDGQSVYVTDNPTDIQEGQRALPLYVTPPPQRQLESTTDMMMGLAERLGELPDDVDPRAWSHLLVYAPQRKLEQEPMKLTEKNLEATLLNLTKTDRPITVKPTTWFGNPAKPAFQSFSRGK